MNPMAKLLKSAADAMPARAEHQDHRFTVEPIWLEWLALGGLLVEMAQGLGIALLTTMVGLVGNSLLGLQRTRPDRYADALVADCQRAGLAVSQDSPR